MISTYLQKQGTLAPNYTIEQDALMIFRMLDYTYHPIDETIANIKLKYYSVNENLHQVERVLPLILCSQKQIVKKMNLVGFETAGCINDEEKDIVLGGA